jgi:hypothetical protein
MRVGVGLDVGIGGFIISRFTQVAIRALGPSLGQAGVPNTISDPILELHGASPNFHTITNDDWRPNLDLDIMGLAPGNDVESAIVVRLVPGSYTAIVRDKNNATGVALVEIYMVNETFAPLSNVSTRAFVATGDDIVIAGFILGGSDDGGQPNLGSDRIVLRGIGPSLLSAVMPTPLADPTLELRNSNGALLMANNNWQDNPAQAAEITAAHLAPLSSLESGIAVTLPPGLYTALLAGANSGTGHGVVEVYDLGGP